MIKLPSFDVSDVAIIGMSCRFPGAKNVAAFWQNLRDGVESISFFSQEELTAEGVELTLSQQPNYVKASGVLSDIELFDAYFFGYSPHETAMLDPQHRLFLECAWEAIESAGYNPEIYKGLIGVYAGTGMNTYLLNNLYTPACPEPSRDYHTMIASDKDFLATRISYKFNLKGPGVTVQTACSTSLVAVHLACQSLRSGECDMALAGGVSVRVPHRTGYLYQEGMILTPDGHCRAFDARAQGTVIGSGAGVVVLKLLGDALADGDQVYAVIKGSTINNDGSLKAGYTAPSLEAQTAVILEAQGVSGITADSITYIEAHGTGTPIGDPIEIAALTKAFRTQTQQKQFCAIGSVKTNIGHLDAAAGVAGLIKTVLALQHQQIPPSLNFTQPNPKIDFAASPFYVNTELAEWKTFQTPRRAGVSSFGIGGTNAHMILEEPPAPAPSRQAKPWQLLLLSAKTESALDTATVNLGMHLRQHPNVNLADMAYTLQIGRRVFPHRRILVCQGHEEAATALLASDPKHILTSTQEAMDRSVVFMFTGQGSQYANMTADLYQAEPIFRQQVDLCCEFLKPHVGFDLCTVLYPNEALIEEATRQLEQTAITQPALFVIEYALAQLWMAWGIQPKAMIGHSIGEYVAACLAGVFSLEDGLALVATRGRLMQQLPGGAMLTVPCAEQDINPYLNQELSLAAVNTPSLCVVSGTTQAIESLSERLTRKGMTCRRLHTSHAFHSAMMDPILESFTSQVKQIALHPPQIPYISNVTGTWITAVQATDPAYWSQHLRQPVRFSQGLNELFSDSGTVLLEVGPGNTLSTLARRHPGKTVGQIVLTSVPHPQERQSDAAYLLTTLGKLWLAGVGVDWSDFHAHQTRQRIPLPTYPFERQRYWVEPPSTHQKNLSLPEADDTKKTDISEWFYIPSWKRSALTPLPLNDSVPSHWLVFMDDYGLGDGLVEKLQARGQSVVGVKVGTRFTKLNDHLYTLNPSQTQEYDVLLQEIGRLGLFPQKVVHLWSITPEGSIKIGLDDLEKSQNLTFYSLLSFAQALGQHNLPHQLSLTAVSNSLHEVTGEETPNPMKATLLGPVRIIPHEYPNVHTRSIDIIFSGVASGFDKSLLELLLLELQSESPDLVVAYRGGHRWVETFELVKLVEQQKWMTRLKPEGVYLITGGLGGIGFVLAQYLAETIRAKLVLIGRTALPAPAEWPEWLAKHGETNEIGQKIRRWQQLESLGSEVLVINADVAQPEQIQTAVQQALSRFGQVNGVIHAAGIPAGGMIQRKSRNSAESVMAPKVKGTLALSAALQNVTLDFLVLFSSINAIVGKIGQVDYCAANAFLDSFATYYNKLSPHRPAMAINWETWQEVGMAAEIASLPFGASMVSPKDLKTAVHPLLDQCLSHETDHQTYLTHFSVNKQWVLYEHGISGKATLPGTAYLEMVCAAFANHTGTTTLEIRDAHFLTPLIFEPTETRPVYTILKQQQDAFEFMVVSQLNSGGWQEHARGTVSPLKEVKTEQHDLNALIRRCDGPRIVDPFKQNKLGGFRLQQQAIQRGFSAHNEPLWVQSTVIAEEADPTQERFMEFGPRWDSLKWVQPGIQEGLALLELPEGLDTDIPSYRLHPALVDLATSFLRLFQSQSSYLPLSYKCLRVRHILPAKIVSYARYIENHDTSGQTLTFNIILLDEHGKELVEIEGFTVIKIQDIRKLTASSGSRLAPADILPYATGLPGKLSADASLLKDLKRGLLPAEGIEVFGRIMGSSLPRTIVSTRHLAARIKQSHMDIASLFAEKIEETVSPKTKHPRPTLMTPYAAPRNEIEKKVAEIWQDMLGIQQVGVHDDFFELGGDSLLITRIHNRFREVFDGQVSVANLLQYPTIADLAEFLGKHDPVEQPSFEKTHDRVSKQKEAIRQRKQAVLQRKR